MLLRIPLLASLSCAAIALVSGAGLAQPGTVPASPPPVFLQQVGHGMGNKVCNCTSTTLQNQSVSHRPKARITLANGKHPFLGKSATGQSGSANLGDIKPGTCRFVEYEWECVYYLLGGWSCEPTGFNVKEKPKA